jgi:hypothetical protein
MILKSEKWKMKFGLPFLRFFTINHTINATLIIKTKKAANAKPIINKIENSLFSAKFGAGSGP